MAAEEKIKQTQKNATISQLTVKICTIRQIYGALEVLLQDQPPMETQVLS